MAGPGGKRIAKELSDITTSPPPGIHVNLLDESDLHQWSILLTGPPTSPYAGGHFKLLLVLPAEYPFKAPKLNFQTKIFHPNVTNDEHGSMCLGLLKGDQWKPSSRIVNVLEAALQVLAEPAPEDAVEAGAAELYRRDRGEFERVAREWTRRYAK